MLQFHHFRYDAPLRALPCLTRAFLEVGGFIDHLEIGRAPKGEKLRPGFLAMLGPDREKRHVMIDLGGFEQPTSGRQAFMPLSDLQRPQVISRRVPKLPGDDAACVPRRILVRLVVAPKIAVPSEPVDRLPAHAAMTRPTGEPGLPIRSRRNPKRKGQPG
jgi:hypothetical protein